MAVSRDKVRINISLSKRLVNVIDAYAEKNHVTRNMMLGWALGDYFHHTDENTPEYVSLKGAEDVAIDYESSIDMGQSEARVETEELIKSILSEMKANGEL